MNRLGYATGVIMVTVSAAAIGYLYGRSGASADRAGGAVVGQPHGVAVDPSYLHGHVLRIFLKGENVSDEFARGSVVCVIDPADLEKRGWEELSCVGRVHMRDPAGHENDESGYTALYTHRELLKADGVLLNLVSKQALSWDDTKWLQVHLMVRTR